MLRSGHFQPLAPNNSHQINSKWIDQSRQRLNGNVYDPSGISLSELRHRDVVMGAIMMVLDATTLNLTDAVR
jgi:hypothetical protein